MTTRKYYSLRTGKNPNAGGFALRELCELFTRLYKQMCDEGYFHEAFGFWCVDTDHIPGKIADPEYEIFVSLRKKDLWPIEQYAYAYSEDDLFDVIEFLHEHASKPVDGTYHNWNNCGMHWETFNKTEGQKYFKEKINGLLALYREPFVLAASGEILHKPEKGFEKIFDADVPTGDRNIQSRLESAVLRFRRHGASLDDRRQAIRDLADVLEYLRPQLKKLMDKQDEADLFNIANNFGIRHHNEKQKTNYDAAIWLSWMFYFYLSTIHVVLRKLENEKLNQRVHGGPKDAP